MRPVIIAISLLAALGTSQAEAAHRHHTVFKVRVDARPPDAPLFYYDRPAPLGAFVTTVSDLPGRHCFSRLVQNRHGWWVRHRWCEALR